MKRAMFILVAILILGGCQLPPEKLPVQPIPENGQPIPYSDAIIRARLQASAANEAFYVNRWNELDDAAKELERSAGLMMNATDVPAKQKDKLNANAMELTKLATLLRDAAKTTDAKQTADILQRINLKVRELRPEQ